MGARETLRKSRNGIAIAAGLTALVALETPVHEGLHCATAELTGGECAGIELNKSTNWYLAPVTAVLPGVELKELPAGVGGVTKIGARDGTFGHLGGMATSAIPEIAYTAIGMGLIGLGLANWRRRPAVGLMQTIAGFGCMKSTFYYAGVSLTGAGDMPGNDYFGTTQHLLQAAYLPGDLAQVLTPVIGVPLIIGTAYAIAGAYTQRSRDRQAAVQPK